MRSTSSREWDLRPGERRGGQADADGMRRWGDEPWYEQDLRRTLAVVVVLFVAVVAVRLPVLAVFPVSLMALTWGLRGGLAGSAAAALATVVVDTDVLRWAATLSAVMLLGVLFGEAQDRSRASMAARLRERAELEQLQLRLARATAAAEISDSVIQGMVAAKWLVEAGNVADGTEVLADTIEQAEVLVSSLVGRQVQSA